MSITITHEEKWLHTHTQPENGKGERKRSIEITTRSGSKEKGELYRGIVWSGIRVLEVVGLILEKFFNFKL